MATRGPQNGRQKVVYSYVFGRSRQLSVNKFFDLSTPSMRKGDDGGKKGKKGKIKMFLVATNVVASRPTGTYDAGSYQIVGNL